MTKSKLKLDRYIKTKSGDKTESHTTSVNLERRHREYLKRRNLNLSLMIRDYLDSLIKEDDDDRSKL